MCQAKPSSSFFRPTSFPITPLSPCAYDDDEDDHTQQLSLPPPQPILRSPKLRRNKNKGRRARRMKLRPVMEVEDEEDDRSPSSVRQMNVPWQQSPTMPLFILDRMAVESPPSQPLVAPVRRRSVERT